MHVPAMDRRVPWIAGVALLAACGSEAANDGTPAFTIVDSAGTEIVTNLRPQSADGDVWTVADTPSVVIGSVDGGDPATQFSMATSALRLSDGRIVVLDSEASEVRWFSPGGEPLSTAGRRGRGPGEFNYASSAMRWRGDTVIVVDRPLIKHVFFDPAGDFVREEALDFEALTALGPRVECQDATLPDRSLLTCQREPGEPPWPPDPGPGHLRQFARYVRIPWGLSSVTPLGRYGGIEQWGVRMGDRTRFVIHPFWSWTHVAVADDPVRVAIALNPEYSVEIWRADGALGRIVRKAHGRRAATPEEIARAEERLTGGDPERARAFRDVPRPDSLAAVTGLVYATTGELLVQHTPWIGPEAPEEVVFDVFDGRGVWLGETRLPGNLQVQEVGEDYVLGVRRDELGVPFVELYSLTRRGSGTR